MENMETLGEQQEPPRIHAGEVSGLQVRLEVAEGNKQLSEAAVEAGVRSHMFGVFHDAGYLGHYALDSENILIYI